MRVMSMLHEIFNIPPPRPAEHARRMVQQAISMSYAEAREPRYRRDDGELVEWTDTGGEA